MSEDLKMIEELKEVRTHLQQQVVAEQIKLDAIKSQKRTLEIKGEVDERIEVVQRKRSADVEVRKLEISRNKLMDRERVQGINEAELKKRQEDVHNREQFSLDTEQRRKKLLTDLSSFNNYKNQVNKELAVAKETIEEAKYKKESIKQEYLDLEVVKESSNERVLVLDKREFKLNEDVKNFDLLQMQYQSKQVVSIIQKPYQSKEVVNV